PLLPISRSAWYMGCASGRFRPGTKLGPRTTAWSAQYIKAVLDSFETSSPLPEESAPWSRRHQAPIGNTRSSAQTRPAAGKPSAPTVVCALLYIMGCDTKGARMPNEARDDDDNRKRPSLCRLRAPYGTTWSESFEWS